MGVLHALFERRLRLGEDIAVVGFDDSQVAQTVPPGITSVRPPLEEAARELVKALQDLLATPSRSAAGRRSPDPHAPRLAPAWPGRSARPPATSATRRAASCNERPANLSGPTPSCCSTRSRRRTPTSLTRSPQVMDDGQLTDGQGRTVDFKNTVLIMTSPCRRPGWGVESPVPPPVSGSTTSWSSRHSAAEELGRIVDLQVALRIGRASERGVTVEPNRAARELLGNMGYDPTYGARPLKRVIQKRLVPPARARAAQGRLRGRGRDRRRRAAGRAARADVRPHAAGIRWRAARGDHPQGAGGDRLGSYPPAAARGGR